MESSAGGVLVRRLKGKWMFAAIQPAGKPAGLWVLPKGQVDEGESGEEAALREIAEETGATGRLVCKLGDTQYWFSWDGERIFKVVSFFLVRYETGRLGEIADEFRHEVADVRWLPLAGASALLAYPGERELAERAFALLEVGPDNQNV
jgi:8-oxo-dGTP pyrophosphatase MutT (NUDIX family)